MLPGMAMVREVMTKSEAEAILLVLDSEGIEATLNSDDAGGSIPALEEASHFQILVREEDLERAKAVVNEHEKTAAEDSDADAGDDEDGDDEE